VVVALVAAAFLTLVFGMFALAMLIVPAFAVVVPGMLVGFFVLGVASSFIVSRVLRRAFPGVAVFRLSLRAAGAEAQQQ
jgi:hypothetical protein